MSKQIRIVIADDHPIVRRGIRQSIEEDMNFTIVGDAEDGETALTIIQELVPDIAVLDIEMPKLDGLAVARKLCDLHLPTKIIFLTMHTDEDLFRVAMELGAKGYLLKDSATEEVVEGIRAVSAGRLYVSPAIATTLLGRRRLPRTNTPVASLVAQLTATESQVLKLIAAGQSSKEIGAELSIHYRTVENHRTNICRKFGIEGANALLRFAVLHKESL